MDCLESFENVIAYYQSFINSNPRTKSIFDKFNEFFEVDLSLIDKWLENQLQNKILKNNNTSTIHRKQGNVYFSQKDLKLSLEYYTKSLSYALPLSEEYGLALANRSAVTFEMKKYSDSLNDINRCLETKYPQQLRPKILLRKAECLLMLTNRDKFLEYLLEIHPFFEKTTFKDHDNFMKKLNHLKNMTISEVEKPKLSAEFKLPLLVKGENPSFANASAKIEMRYDSVRGRHVVAKEPVFRGDVLFVEKAYCFGVVYNAETKNINQNKCYNCLRDIFSGIPCNSCVQCMFCDETCRDLSWDEYHKWECAGMQTDIWYHLGLTFPAMRVLFKAGSSIYTKKDLDKNCPGYNTSKSQLFDSLAYHVCDDIGALVCSATVVRYLAKYTDFFTWLSTEGNGCDKDLPKMFKHVGGILTRNILQLGSNSSLIEHWIENDLSLPEDRDNVACGIFPSVSIMNHSCKANIAYYFIADTIVVKALENIQENSEISNCYGIDYKFIGRDQRQELCQSLYNFKCTCVICSDFKRELDYFDCFKCQACGHDVQDNISLNVTNCKECKAKVDLRKLRSIIKNNVPDGNGETALLECLKFKEKILSSKHSELQEVKLRLYRFYLRNEDYDNSVKYFNEWLENEKIRMGECSKHLAPFLYENGLMLHRYSTSKQCKNSRYIFEIAKNMMKEARQISSLHYPGYIIERAEFDLKE